MKLIVGLGNPGDEYLNTRHNVGFMLLDYLVSAHNAQPFKNNKKCEAECTEIHIHNEQFLLQKPLTFMNNSGRAVKKCMDFYKIYQRDIFIVHDDLDIQLGKYKIQMGKGPKVHNGVNSIELALATPDFMRVRIGIDSRTSEDKMTGKDFVLHNFTPDDERTLQPIFKDICESILSSK